MVTDLTASEISVPESSSAALEQSFTRLLQTNQAALRRLAASYARSSDRDDLLQ
jgi:DNA-directed RNA polymerase specialized sigma24 family protein